MKDKLSVLIAELQEEYIAAMPERVAKLELLYRQNRIEQLTDEFHKLKGTGKTYGVPEISELGEALEKLCQVAPKQQLEWLIPCSIKVLALIITAYRNQSISTIDLDEDFNKIRKAQRELC